MLFPDGFTGFRRQNDAAIPSIDPAVFKSVCFAAARTVGGKITEFVFAKETPNFHSATFEWDAEHSKVNLLCNRTHYIACFCRPKLTHFPNVYLDVPDLASAIHQICDWYIFSRAELETVIDDSIFDSMSKADRYVVESAWRKDWFGSARTVGDFVFHSSD